MQRTPSVRLQPQSRQSVLDKKCKKECQTIRASRRLSFDLRQVPQRYRLMCPPTQTIGPIHHRRGFECPFARSVRSFVRSITISICLLVLSQSKHQSTLPVVYCGRTLADQMSVTHRFVLLKYQTADIFFCFCSTGAPTFMRAFRSLSRFQCVHSTVFDAFETKRKQKLK